MKFKNLFVALLALTVLVPAFGQKKKDKKNDAPAATSAPALKLENKKDTISYCIGVLFGSTLAAGGLNDINTQKLTQGIEEKLSQKPTLFDEAKSNEIIGQYVMGLRKAKAEKNLEESKSFLKKNKTEQGVVTLPSGLQYKILQEGNGPKPDSGANVTVHYHGTLVNGKVFDSSVERGQPIQLNVNNVIEGWKEALKLMPVGSKWKLFVPSNLAYGENPRPGGPIEANMALIFEVELISIDKEEPAQPEIIEQVKPADQPAQINKTVPAKEKK